MISASEIGRLDRARLRRLWDGRELPVQEGEPAPAVGGHPPSPKLEIHPALCTDIPESLKSPVAKGGEGAFQAFQDANASRPPEANNGTGGPEPLEGVLGDA